MNGCERPNCVNMIGLTSANSVLDRADMELNIIDLFMFSISSFLKILRLILYPHFRDCAIDDL